MQIGDGTMRKFDYSFLDNGSLPAGLLNLTMNIASLKTEVEIGRASCRERV